MIAGGQDIVAKESCKAGAGEAYHIGAKAAGFLFSILMLCIIAI